MPIAAGVIGIIQEAAGIAFFYVSAQADGAADFEEVHDLTVVAGRVVVPAIFIAIEPEDVGDFPGWTWFSQQLFRAVGMMHLFSLRSGPVRVA
jgi:hypothetical protein